MNWGFGWSSGESSLAVVRPLPNDEGGRLQICCCPYPGRSIIPCIDAQLCGLVLPRRRRQCSNCTRVFPWFSIQHNAWSFEVSESVRNVGAQRTVESRTDEPKGSVLATSLNGMQMKEKICLASLLLGTNHGFTANSNESVLQCNGNIPVHLDPRSSSYSIRWEVYAYRVSGFSRSTVSPFSEAWR
jgi:hypothetical protein